MKQLLCLNLYYIKKKTRLYDYKVPLYQIFFLIHYYIKHSKGLFIISDLSH